MRDPRLEPRPGDVLRGKNEGDGSPARRTVTGVLPHGNVLYRQYGFGPREIITSNWKQWAATAEVVRRGE